MNSMQQFEDYPVPHTRSTLATRKALNFSLNLLQNPTLSPPATFCPTVTSTSTSG
ncbi:hypothetical protein CY34DRAFT_17619 [Suillus luteus UH-Slu-Lm8-n1]|uniref:Uncharacterized protein n=1 Tax=Suillus luteus UH-Slu-Lm8-n1 TaxID=930992 RepID=A0A0C9ZAM2_9AGAM|nr:hypothetical protein CY34DRAFT_17619 [Suillus luteus UH-Slu-Lm8-n1]